MKQIYSLSGTQGVGKSTAAARKYIDLKLAHPEKSIALLCDLEADCPWVINDEMTFHSQTWLFGNQMRQEQHFLSNFDIVVTDRTILDIVAYTHTAGFHALAAGMMEFAGPYMENYHEITIKQIRFNNHFHADGIRDISNPDFRQRVETKLLEFFDQLALSGYIDEGLFHAC